MSTDNKSWFEIGYEEYLKKLYKESEERQAARHKRVREKYPECVYVIQGPRELFEKCYPGVEY